MEIKLIEIEKNNNTIRYNYNVSEELQAFFTKTPFFIKYQESVENIPNAILAIPFVSNVLPLMWLTDSKLMVPELDESFYNCIPKVKKGYEDMYPEAELKGILEVEKVVHNTRKASRGKSALFYSGGVDSMDTLYRHLDENPLLVSIWGSDIQYDNEDGWKLLKTAIDEAAEHFHLAATTIRSRFREFDNEGELNKSFSSILQRNYWYGIKHGLALLGHVAVLAYMYRLETFYIASSNCIADGTVRTASDPRTDNFVRFASCRVIHDGYEYSRQDKIRNIVQFNKDKNSILPLHVCWENQTGKNCCKCEKCYRTMVGLILENAEPVEYGFPDINREIPFMQERIVLHSNSAPKTWNRLHEEITLKQNTLKKNTYWKYIRWLKNADFITPGGLRMPLMWRIKRKLNKLIKRFLD